MHATDSGSFSWPSQFFLSKFSTVQTHLPHPPPATDLSFPLAFLLACTTLYLPAPRFLDLPLTFFSDFLLHTTPIFYSIPFSRALLTFVPGVGDWGQRVVRVGVPSLCIVRPVVDQSSAL